MGITTILFDLDGTLLPMDNDAMNVSLENCLIIGNDVNEDMIARSLGASVFLLTDYIINRDGKDISVYPNGNYDDLRKFLELDI